MRNAAVVVMAFCLLLCGCSHREASLAAAYERLTFPQRHRVAALMLKRGHGSLLGGVGPWCRTDALLADLEACVVQVRAESAGRYRLAARWGRLTRAQQYRVADLMRERMDPHGGMATLGLDAPVWLETLETCVAEVQREGR